MTGSRITLIVFTLGSLSLAGCVHPRGWSYEPMPPIERAALNPNALVVWPLTDHRPVENRNRAWVYLIPLMPYGQQDLNRPEDLREHIHSSTWQFMPAQDIAKALVAEIGNRRIFTEVSSVSSGSGGDLILVGDLVSTRYEATLLSYGLSIAGPDLWALGLPVGSVKNTLAFKLRLEEGISRTIIWEGSYSAERDEGLFSLYNLAEDFCYDALLKELMPKVLSDLELAANKSLGRDN